MTPTPKWYWAAAGISMIWNAFGAMDYTMTNLRVPAYLAGQPPAAIDLVNAMPPWAVGAWALGVWASLAGSLLLLARRRRATECFALSLLGAVGSYAWQYAHGAAAIAPGFAVLAGVICTGIVAQLWFARAMFWRGVVH